MYKYWINSEFFISCNIVWKTNTNSMLLLSFFNERWWILFPRLKVFSYQCLIQYLSIFCETSSIAPLSKCAPPDNDFSCPTKLLGRSRCTLMFRVHLFVLHLTPAFVLCPLQYCRVLNTSSSISVSGYCTTLLLERHPRCRLVRWCKPPISPSLPLCKGFPLLLLQLIQ